MNSEIEVGQQLQRGFWAGVTPEFLVEPGYGLAVHLGNHVTDPDDNHIADRPLRAERNGSLQYGILICSALTVEKDDQD